MSTVGKPKLTAYKNDLIDMKKRLIFCAGLPSTGKTKQAIDCAVKEIQGGFYDKLIIIRPVIIPKAGLLPGTLLEKMAPYTRQSNLYCKELNNEVTLEDLIDTGRAEIIPTDLLQGNRFSRCYVVMDEMQNIPKSETFKILTRLGEGSKFVIIGDISRGQLGRDAKFGDTMLDYCINKFAGKYYAGVHYFYSKDDLLGDDVTKEVIVELIEDFVM
jgi:phosphate starvation-inducible PhoH-like protein